MVLSQSLGYLWYNLNGCFQPVGGLNRFTLIYLFFCFKQTYSITDSFVCPNKKLMFRPDICNSYPAPGLRLLLTSVASKIRTSFERIYRKCWHFQRVKAIVSRWSFLSLQGNKRSKITIQNSTYYSQIQVAFLDTSCFYKTDHFIRTMGTFLCPESLTPIYSQPFFLDTGYLPTFMTEYFTSENLT